MLTEVCVITLPLRKSYHTFTHAHTKRRIMSLFLDISERLLSSQHVSKAAIQGDRDCAH